MNSVRLLIWVGVLLLLMSGPVTWAQTVDIVGVVSDSVTAAPVENATVIILETDDTVHTDVLGVYTFYDMTPGIYTLLIGGDNYAPRMITGVNTGLSCCNGIRGNANNDVADHVNVSDVTYLVSYLFGIPSGPAPVCTEEGNANGDVGESINVSDVTYLVSYLFGIPSGPAPPACQ